MTYRMTHEQLITHIRYLADCEASFSSADDNGWDNERAVMHAHAANLLVRLAERAEAERIKTPQLPRV